MLGIIMVILGRYLVLELSDPEGEAAGWNFTCRSVKAVRASARQLAGETRVLQIHSGITCEPGLWARRRSMHGSVIACKAELSKILTTAR